MAATGAVLPTVEELGELVLDTFRQVLGNPSLSPTDNMFEVGGDSLLGLKIVKRLEEATGVTLPIASLFVHPTPDELARALVERLGASRRVA